MADMQRLMCEAPAKLCGIDGIKGKMAEGYDADFCVWNPDEEFTVTSDIVQFRNKANPYIGMKLKGRVHATFVRGNIVYSSTAASPIQPAGVLLKSQFKK